MSLKDIESRVIGNQFWNSLRDGHWEQEEFDRLCSAMSELAIEWGRCDTINKEIVDELYAVSTALWGWVVDPRKPNSSFDLFMWDNAVRFSGLFQNCLRFSNVP